MGSITQSIKKFFVYAIGTVLYNIGIVIGIIFLKPEFGLYGVVFGVVIGAVLHLIIQLPVIIKNGLLPKFSLNIDYKAIKEVLILFFTKNRNIIHGALSDDFFDKPGVFNGEGARYRYLIFL